MTAQISDIYKHKRNKYNLVALSDPIGFEPKDYGLDPQASCTACRRGYWCEYDIREDGLYLDKLFLHNGEGNYPDFNGVSAISPEYEELEYIEGSSNKRGRRKFPKNMGHWTYDNANLLIPYTGKILLGDKFLREYYIHMGYQQAFAYEILLEFVFENGKLIESIDHSDKVKKMRESMDLDELIGRNDVTKFVNDSFSLDYKTKAWWLEI